MEPTWLKEALFAGQTANGFKMGIAASLGWFWARIKGCRLVYRGENMETVNFDDVLVVTDAEASEITIPDYVSHEPGQVYFYIVRCANRCGQIEQTKQAAVRVAIEGDGKMQGPRPNSVFGLSGRQRQDGKFEMTWQYNPVGQGSGPQQMKVYCDGGAGEVDYQQQVGTVQYKGRRFYRYESRLLIEGRIRFAVRAADVRGNDDGSIKAVEADIQNKPVEPVEIVKVE